MKEPIKLPWIKFSKAGGNKRGHWRAHEAHRNSALAIGRLAAKNYNFILRETTKINGYSIRVVLKPPINRYPDWDNAANALKYYMDGICMQLGIDDNEISNAIIERGAKIKGGEVWIFID